MRGQLMQSKEAAGALPYCMVLQRHNVTQLLYLAWLQPCTACGCPVRCRYYAGGFYINNVQVCQSRYATESAACQLAAK